ncbi:hypothetical protein [Mangrovimonas xylaniphaga]|uniref:hypothetical protein n=1 Tax=Mangrovimonas xylaniphaga TaxID=1645915 RepID=UPI0006B5D52E|nr:hypothetical protein [Mangrovimonas xylaniphaga]
MISIEYTVKDHGWTNAQIGNGTIIEEIHASYLHDTFADFANAAIHLLEKKQQTVVFFREPGESQLILNMINEKEITQVLQYRIVDLQSSQFKFWPRLFLFP